MKYILFTFLLLFSSQSYCQLKGAIKQENVPDHFNEERKTENSSITSIAKNNALKMKKSLKLNDKQHSELYKILLEYETQVEKTTSSNLSKKDQYTKLNKLNMAKQDKLKAILTPEQYKAYMLSFP